MLRLLALDRQKPKEGLRHGLDFIEKGSQKINEI
jgi:hypothetical protein